MNIEKAQKKLTTVIKEIRTKMDEEGVDCEEHISDYFSPAEYIDIFCNFITVQTRIHVEEIEKNKNVYELVRQKMIMQLELVLNALKA